MSGETFFAICAALLFGLLVTAVVILNYHVNVSLTPVDFPKGTAVIHLSQLPESFEPDRTVPVRLRLTSLHLFAPKQSSGC